MPPRIPPKAFLSSKRKEGGRLLAPSLRGGQDCPAVSGSLPSPPLPSPLIFSPLCSRTIAGQKDSLGRRLGEGSVLCLLLLRGPSLRPGPGRRVAAEPWPLRRAHGHGRHAVHGLHLQSVRHQRGQVGRPHRPGPGSAAPARRPQHAPRRFVAVAAPLRYNRRSRGGRQLLLIGATWLLSAAVAAPVLCGLNDARGRDPSVCRLEDRDYVVYSSVCSFFLPCPLMLLLYWATFRGLRRWEAARRAKLHGRAPRRPSGPGPPPPDGIPAPDAAAPPDAIPAPDCIPPHDAIPAPYAIPGPDATPPPDAIPGPDATPPPDATPASDAVLPSDAMPAEPPLRARRRRRTKISGRERKAMRVLPVVVGGYRPGDVGREGKTAAPRV